MPHPSDSPQFLASDHLSRRTRDILMDRMDEDSIPWPQTLSPTAFGVLERIIPVLLPQEEVLGEHRLNLACRVDLALKGPRDGWRFAELPSDGEAWEQALLTLNDLSIARHDCPFHQLEARFVGTFLDEMGEGRIGLEAPNRLTPPKMQKWSFDLRADVIESFLADPRVQNALGISANLNGGDSRFQGFETVQANQREAFEPVSCFSSQA